MGDGRRSHGERATTREPARCATCGHALDITHPDVSLVVCPACAACHLVEDSGELRYWGAHGSLDGAPTTLTVGTRVAVRGRGLTILGRTRLQHEDEIRDAWQVAWDDEAPADWLEAEDGIWTLYHEEPLTGPVPSLEDIRVGDTVQVGEYEVFITGFESITGRRVIHSGADALASPRTDTSSLQATWYSPVAG